MIAVSRRRRALRYTERVIALKGGRVEAQGRFDVLLATSAELRAIWSAARER